MGSGKEFVGNLVGSKDLASSGHQQNTDGQGREATGQAKDYAGGAVDRVTGAIGSGIASVTGNPNAESEFSCS